MLNKLLLVYFILVIFISDKLHCAALMCKGLVLTLRTHIAIACWLSPAFSRLHDFKRNNFHFHKPEKQIRKVDQ